MLSKFSLFHMCLSEKIMLTIWALRIPCCTYSKKFPFWFFSPCFHLVLHHADKIIVINWLKIIMMWCINIHIANATISASLSVYLPCLQTCLSQKSWAATIRFKTWIESMCARKVKSCLTFNILDLWVERSSPMHHTPHSMKLLSWLSLQELQGF